jgi:hypothetical protein
VTEAEGDALVDERETLLRVLEAVMDAVVEGEATANGLEVAAAIVEGEGTSMGATGIAIKAVIGGNSSLFCVLKLF